MRNPAELFRRYSGPIVIVGNGPSLDDIPDSFLRKYPTFGCNAIHLREGFKPTYYAVADDWIAGLWQRVYELFRNIPKFALDRMPSLKSGDWDVYPYRRRDGPVWLDPETLHPGYLFEPGIAFRGIVHAMIQMALFMGYDKFYLVGCDNTQDGGHFYENEFTKAHVDANIWEWAFDTLQTCLLPRPIINLSTRGKINCLPWADWRNL